MCPNRHGACEKAARLPVHDAISGAVADRLSQDFAGGNDPNNREILWPTGYSQSTDTFKFLAAIIAFRKSAQLWNYPQVSVPCCGACCVLCCAVLWCAVLCCGVLWCGVLWWRTSVV